MWLNTAGLSILRLMEESFINEISKLSFRIPNQGHDFGINLTINEIGNFTKSQ